MWEADEDFQEPVPIYNPVQEERFQVREPSSVNGDPGTFLRRHLNVQLVAARQVLDDVRASNMGLELMSRFPTLASPRTRPRAIDRQPLDRRRNASVKIQLTAVDNPAVSTTNNIKMKDLLSKNLGRREDTTFQLPLTTTMEALRQKVVDLFPPLMSTDFQILLGRRPCHLVNVEANSVGDFKRHAPRGILRLWARPTVFVEHGSASLPTQSAVVPTDSQPTSPTPPPAFTSSLATSTAPVPIFTSASTDPQPMSEGLIPLSSATFPSTPPISSREQTTMSTASSPIAAPQEIRIILEQPTADSVLTATGELEESRQQHEESLILELETSVDDDLTSGIEKMKGRIQGDTQHFWVKRERLGEDIFDLYKDLVDITRPLSFTYEQEDGEDMGGISRDVFSHFWEIVFKKYFKGEGVCVPYLPANRRHEAVDVYSLIGKILEHFIGLFGRLPLRLCRSSVLALADPDLDVGEDMLLEDFLKFLPESDRVILEHALSETSWPVVVGRQLELFYTLYGLTVLPSSENLSRCLLNLAQVELLDKPMAYLRLMRRGLTVFAKSTFFARLNADSLRRFVAAFQPCKDKLVSMLLDLSDSSSLNPQQEVVLYYLIALVRDFSGGQFRHFLRWVTGSETMPESLSITFNSVFGAARRPVAHTCGNVLELSQEYDSYQEFKDEVMAYIFSADSFRFTMM